MNSDFDDSEDISLGQSADHSSIIRQSIPKDLAAKFEFYSYKNAAPILANSFPSEFASIIDGLRSFQINTEMIRTPGGNKGPITRYVDTIFTKSDGWHETRIRADLHVKLLHAKKREDVIDEYVRNGFLDGHRIDFLNGRVAFDLEWNSKDQTFDRDLYAFSAFYDAGAIDVGVILTRGNALDNDFFRSLGKVLNKDGSEGREEVYKKYGASTTWMGKLLYRLDAGRNGGCPILAIGITPNCVI